MTNENDYKQLAFVMARWYLNACLWSLIPIIPDAKKPPIKWKEFQNRRPSLDEVTGWIKNGWYLAVVTGPISNILIIDDDREKNGLSEWGFSSSIISTSQNKGKHFYFKYDREIHRYVNKDLHVDLIALYSYCLVPPFGNRKWISKPSRQNLGKLNTLPSAIENLIHPKTEFVGSPKFAKPIPKYNPVFIEGESWLQRVERAKKAPPEVFVYPYLNKLRRTYDGIESLCPFHSETTPSFNLYSPIKNFQDFHFKCYGCNLYGIGIIAFHMQRKNLDFKSAVRDLTS